MNNLERDLLLWGAFTAITCLIALGFLALNSTVGFLATIAVYIIALVKVTR
jgi:hypothetical protein